MAKDTNCFPLDRVSVLPNLKRRAKHIYHHIIGNKQGGQNETNKVNVCNNGNMHVVKWMWNEESG